MIHDRVIVLALLACWPVPGAAQQRAPAECMDSSKTQAGIAACSGDSYEAADRRLQLLVAELRDSVPALQRAQRPCPAADRYRPPDRVASKRLH